MTALALATVLVGIPGLASAKQPAHTLSAAALKRVLSTAAFAPSALSQPPKPPVFVYRDKPSRACGVKLTADLHATTYAADQHSQELLVFLQQAPSPAAALADLGRAGTLCSHGRWTTPAEWSVDRHPGGGLPKGAVTSQAPGAEAVFLARGRLVIQINEIPVGAFGSHDDAVLSHALAALVAAYDKAALA